MKRDADDPETKGFTAWAIFPGSTKYFDPSRAGHMINCRVDDLEGNRIELWNRRKRRVKSDLVVTRFETILPRSYTYSPRP